MLPGAEQIKAHLVSVAEKLYDSRCLPTVDSILWFEAITGVKIEKLYDIDNKENLVPFSFILKTKKKRLTVEDVFDQGRRLDDVHSFLNKCDGHVIKCERNKKKDANLSHYIIYQAGDKQGVICVFSDGSASFEKAETEYISYSGKGVEFYFISDGRIGIINYLTKEPSERTRLVSLFEQTSADDHSKERPTYKQDLPLFFSEDSLDDNALNDLIQELL